MRIVQPVAAFMVFAAVAACTHQPATISAVSQSVPEYPAEVFFQTTDYGMAASSGHAFSAKTGELLISSNATGVFNAYAMDPLTGNTRALTNSTDNAVFPVSWFPSDDRILYTFDEGGNELNHVYVRETDGSTRDLTPGNKLKANFGGWLAEGTAFWLTTNERDQRYFDVYRYLADGYERELLFKNDAGFQPAALSRDGRWLALVRPRTSADSDVFVVDLASAERKPVLVTEHEGNISHGVYDFTPDSRALVYSTNEYGEYVQAWRYDLITGKRSVLVAADWDVSYVFYSPSGRYRVSAINEDASTALTIFDREVEQSLALPALPAGDLNQVRFSRDEQSIALMVRSDISPSNVHVIDLAAVRPTQRQLTQAMPAAIDPAHLVESEVIRYKSYDGLEIPSILYRPKGADSSNPAPTLVWVHGGPGGQSRKGYSATLQHLVNHGYGVLMVNNRGSSGYGKTFFHMDDRRHGDVDLDDIVAARDYLQDLDWVDGERIGIIGGSYGGYMVAAALAFRPDVFDVGIDIFGVTNWVRTLTSIPPWWESFKEALYDEMGDPATDGERHRAISPLFHAEKIRKPLLVVQGANDPRVLQVESDELVEAVRANGVPVTYLVFEDEGHGFLRTENRISASRAYVEFLDAYLAK